MAGLFDRINESGESRYSSMETLVLKLNEAAEAYYNGQEIMTNFEYDKLLDELKALEAKEGKVLPYSPTRNVGAKAVDFLPKFTHTYPALSLDKTKDVEEFVSKFKKGIAESGSDNDNVVLMWKEDGSTVQAYYTGGRLRHLVTRGNGEIGSDITHNAKCIKGLPLEIPYGGDLVVRGEAVMSYEEFERINATLPDDQKYKNPRNLAAATLTMLDSEEASQRKLQLKAFNLVHITLDCPQLHTFSGRLDTLMYNERFDTVEAIKIPVDKLAETIQEMTEHAKLYPYPVDGLVAVMDNYDYASKLQGTEHHPHIMNGYAFKWADDTYETVLREIEWSPSRTGLLNPVAIFDPVEIDGTTVSRASVHNMSVMRELNLVVGNRITVYKSNLIIPQIAENLDKDTNDDSDYLTRIGFNELCCPTCGAKAILKRSLEGIATVYCPNSDCPEKLVGKLAHFCSRDCMNIDGMSEETIRKLNEAGFVKEYTDFFYLDKQPGIAFLPGFGKQSWSKMCQAAEKAKTTDFVRFFTAMGIDNWGKGQIKSLKKYLNDNYESLATQARCLGPDYNLGILLATLGVNNFDFSKIDGIGTILSDSLVKWINEHFNIKLWQDPDSGYYSPELNVYGCVRFTDKPESSVSTSSISGKSFCITGKLIHFSNRQELVDKIESLGGKWVDSVSSKTDYLINNDTTSTSGKNKKAQELNIPIISEEKFLEMVK